MKFLTKYLLALCITASPVFAVNSNHITGQASVIDGDTLEIRGERIRLHGIDAPESGQSCVTSGGTSWRCGQKASLALADRIDRRPVTCEISGRDRYDRAIGVCSQGGTDLNGWMVQNGWAVAYVKYSRDYVGQENRAKSTRAGIWEGKFVPPSDWRRGTRLDHGPKTASRECAIKGNISSKGKRIYHMPGMKWYAKTKISESKGERWFCTEAEARAAGWSRSKG